MNNIVRLSPTPPYYHRYTSSNSHMSIVETIRGIVHVLKKYETEDVLEYSLNRHDCRFKLLYSDMLNIACIWINLYDHIGSEFKDGIVVEFSNTSYDRELSRPIFYMLRIAIEKELNIPTPPNGYGLRPPPSLPPIGDGDDNHTNIQDGKVELYTTIQLTLDTHTILDGMKMLLDMQEHVLLQAKLDVLLACYSRAMSFVNCCRLVRVSLLFLRRLISLRTIPQDFILSNIPPFLQDFMQSNTPTCQTSNSMNIVMRHDKALWEEILARVAIQDTDFIRLIS